MAIGILDRCPGRAGVLGGQVLIDDGQDLRRLPVEARKAGLAQLLRTPSLGIALNEHYVG
jgi:hypothetical protein